MSRRDYEYEGMNPRQRERMRPRKKGGVAGKIIAAVLGFLFGIIATVGSVAGVGYYFATTTTVKDAINKVNDLAGTQIDYKEYVTDEYANQTVIGLVGKLQKVADDMTKNGGTFEKLNEISPKVATAIDALAKTLKEYGSSMEQSEINNKLMTEKFDSLGLALEEIIYTLQLGKLLESTNNLDTSDELMMYLCFGEKGESEASGDYHLDEKGKVVVHDSADPITIGSLATGGINDVLADMPLDALIDDSELNEDNPVMLALAYGTEGTHWDWKNGEVKMRQQAFVKGLLRSGETFYGIDGNAVTATAISENVYSVSETDEESGQTSIAFYLQYDEATGVYLAWSNEACDTPYRYPKTTVGDLQSGAGDLIDGIELAPIFGVSMEDIKKAHDSDPLNDPDAVILALAYGEKGTHYDLDGNGDVVWIGENKPRTISSLTDDGGASALLDEIKLSTLLNISPLDKYTDPDNEPDAIMLTLAFGEEGTHYTLKDSNGDGTPDTIEWVGDNKERTVKDLTDENTDIFDEMTLASVLNIKPSDNKVMISLAYGNSSRYTVNGDKFIMNPVVYTLVGTTVYNDEYEPVLENATANANGVYTLTQDETTVYLKGENGVLYAYASEEEAVAGAKETRFLYKKTVLNDLKGNGASDLIGSIELGAALDVDILTADENTSELLLALAFGYEDENYEIATVNGVKSVQWLVKDSATGEKYAPRTIDDLSKNSEEVFDSIRLATVLEVTPASHAIIIALAYGEEGEEGKDGDFEYVDLNEDGIIDENDGFKSINGSKPHTVKELKEGGGAELLDDIELSAIFYEPNPEKDKVQMFIIYGKEDIHYSYTKNDDGTYTISMLQKRMAVCADGVIPYDEYGHRLGGKISSYDGEGDHQCVYTETDADGNVTLTYYLTKVTYAPPLTEITDEGTTADFYFVYEKTEDGSYVPVMFDSRTLGQLTRDKTLLDDISKALTVRDFLGDEAGLDTNFVLKHVADNKIDELPRAIENLTVQQVFAEEIYKHKKDSDNQFLYFVDENGAQLYYNEVNGKWYTSSDFTEGTQSARVMEGTWKYLLMATPEGETEKIEQNYKLSEINKMINNMKENVRDATLAQLYVDGLINTQPDESIANYTIDGLIDLVSTLKQQGNS